MRLFDSGRSFSTRGRDHEGSGDGAGDSASIRCSSIPLVDLQRSGKPSIGAGHRSEAVTLIRIASLDRHLWKMDVLYLPRTRLTESRPRHCSSAVGVPARAASFNAMRQCPCCRCNQNPTPHANAGNHQCCHQSSDCPAKVLSMAVLGAWGTDRRPASAMVHPAARDLVPALEG